jgi:ribosomal protein L11 methyltransferase
MSEGPLLADQLHVDVPDADAELAADLLFRAGATAVEERPSPHGGVRLVADPPRSSVAAISDRWPTTWVSVDVSADLDAWRQWAVPVRAGIHLVVHPAWQDPPAARQGDVVVSLDPGRAFGTGSHPSTRLALAAIERWLRPGDRVLDLGCGSGVLSIAAAKLGAGHVLAVDVDPAALVATAENAVRNGVTIDLGVTASGPVDVAVANIGAAALIELAPAIDARTIILSGLLADRADEVVASYPGYVEVERGEEDGWSAPVLQARTPVTAVTGTGP